MGIHKVHSFKSGSTYLKGEGQTIHVADFNCDDNHDIYDNKTITNLDDGDAGESTFDAADSSDNHCQGVSMFAAGDSGARTGVAPDADLILSRNIKIITNAGGVNPYKCAEEIKEKTEATFSISSDLKEIPCL